MGPCLGDPRHLGKHLDCSPILSPYPIAIASIPQLLTRAERLDRALGAKQLPRLRNPPWPGAPPLQHSNGEALPSHGKEARTQKTN